MKENDMVDDVIEKVKDQLKENGKTFLIAIAGVSLVVLGIVIGFNTSTSKLDDQIKSKTDYRLLLTQEEALVSSGIVETRKKLETLEKSHEKIILLQEKTDIEIKDIVDRKIGIKK